MKRVVVPIVAVLCIGLMGFVVYQLKSESKKLASEQAANGRANQSGPRLSAPAPEITGVDVDGKEFKLSDYRGKVVVLDFWGFW